MKAILYLGAALCAVGLAAAAPAQDNVRRVIVYGNDACPRSSNDEIVVCARRPNSDRYRIPEELREGSKNPENESWASRAESLETIGASGIQSCSTVGPGGYTGCWAQMMRDARKERQRAKQRR